MRKAGASRFARSQILEGKHLRQPRYQRFISEDPLGFAGGVNFYAYASDSPVNLRDPFGLKPNPCQSILCSPLFWQGVGIAALAVAAPEALPLEFAAEAEAVADAEEAAAATRTVIGHFPDYVNLAKELGANYLNVPTEEWEAMSEAEQWATNQQFLDNAIANGDVFQLATPLEDMNPGSFFEQEVQYLLDNGYELSPDGTQLIPPGGN